MLANLSIAAAILLAWATVGFLLSDAMEVRDTRGVLLMVAFAPLVLSVLMILLPIAILSVLVSAPRRRRR